MITPGPSRPIPCCAGRSTPDTESPPDRHHGRNPEPIMASAPSRINSRNRRPPPSIGSAPRWRAAVDRWLQHTDVGQVAVALVEVESVADDESVRNREADVVDRDLRQTPCGLVEQAADADRGRIALPQVAQQVVQGEAGVDDVLDNDDVAPLDRLRQVL